MNKKLNGIKGITLVALVITIIVLLILAGITIATLTGENGLFKRAKQAELEYGISAAKEKLELAITDLRVEKISKGEDLQKEHLPELNSEDIQIGSIEEFPIEAICDKYKFEIDENFAVKYVGEIDGTIITYTTEPEGYTNQDKIKISIKVVNPKGIQTIEKPNGEKISAGGQTEIKFDYDVTANGTYTFKVVDNINKEVIKNIVIDKIDKLAPLDFTIEVQQNGSSITIIGDCEDSEATDDSCKSGIDYYEYYLGDSDGNKEKYNTNKIEDIATGTYQVYGIAYDRAGNSKQSNIIENIEIIKTSGITAKDIDKNPKAYFGKKVTNYKSKNGISDWKIFYSNKENIFLITDTYVDVTDSEGNIDTTRLAPSGMGLVSGSKNRVNFKSCYQTTIPEDVNRLTFPNVGESLNYSYKNSKCSSMLLNSNSWAYYMDEDTGSGQMAMFAIGGPTLYLWCSSWNRIYQDKLLYPTYAPNSSKDSGSGLRYNDNTYNRHTELDLKEKNDLYFPIANSEISTSAKYWIASPSGYEAPSKPVGYEYGKFIWSVAANGKIGYEYYQGTSTGLRPVVCLNKEIKVNIEEEK